MRVLNVNILIDPVTGGGGAERTVQISRFLRSSGVETVLLTMDLGVLGRRLEALDGVEVIALKCLSKRFYVPAFSLRALNALIRSVDIVHIMGHWTILNALVYALCRHTRTPYVVCPAGSLPIFGRSKAIKRLYNWVVGRRIIGNAAHCVAISVEEIEHFCDYGVSPEKVVLIPNGVDLSEAESPDRDSFSAKVGGANGPIILFVGRLNYIKGPDILLEAFAKITDHFEDCQLVFAGPDSGMLARLKEMAAASVAADRVHFVGYVGGDEKFGAYSAASLLVIPSRQEAMSIVVLEAGSVGTPVLLTDRCGFDEVEEVGGGKVVPADTDGIEQGLRELLGDPATLATMGSRLREFVTQKYTWESMIKKYVGLYEDILVGPRP